MDPKFTEEELIEFGIKMVTLARDPFSLKLFAHEAEERFHRSLSTEIGKAFKKAMKTSEPADPRLPRSFWRSIFIKKRYPFLEKLKTEYTERYGDSWKDGP